MLLKHSAPSHAISKGATAGAKRVPAVACRASSRDGHSQPAQAPVGQVLAGLAATCLVLSPMAPAPALAEEALSPVDKAYEVERQIQDQKSMAEFKLQQQENAKKAELNAQRKSLERQVIQVESQLEQKLTEQKANIVAASSKGDMRKADALEAQADELRIKLEQVQKVAAQLTSQVDRMEILESAKNMAARQSMNRTAMELDAAVNARLDKWLESVTPGK